MDRSALETRWLTLTRETLPAAAAKRGWSVRFDHCFQRILLDNAVGGFWRDHIEPPAYRNADDGVLGDAIQLGEDALGGRADMHALNAQSLKWRGKQR